MGVLVAVFITIAILSALPVVRKRHHNVFEHHHRFSGWMGLVTTWVFVVLSGMQIPVTTANGKITGWKWSAVPLIHSPQFWFTLFITILVFLPWLTVRKVPVEVTTVRDIAFLL